jgi:hypothetical protein
MSTSHYSKSIQPVYDHLDLTSPSRTDDYPEPGMDIKTVAHDWQDPLSHPSLAHSRPECRDVGSSTIKITDRYPVPENTRRSTMPKLLALLAWGVALLLLDGCAIAHFADTSVEATIIALVTMPAAGFLIATAIHIRNVL